MPLNCVTITGADRATSIDDMVALSKTYPFVEWGILVGSHQGESRFPDTQWIKALVNRKASEKLPMQLSLHVCGQHLRDIAIGRSELDEVLGYHLVAFDRVQLNWHGERQHPQCSVNILSAFCKLVSFHWDPTLIFQLDGVNDDLYQGAARKFACCGLFDRSHGAGVVPGEWPQASTEMACGWAGGLGPENLAEELPRIDEKAWPALNYWVDMETRVRTREQLDLDKVAESLAIAKGFMEVVA